MFEITAPPGTNRTITSCLHQKLLVQRTYGQNRRDGAAGRKKRHPESSSEAQGWVGDPAGDGSLDTSQGHHHWGSSLPPRLGLCKGEDAVSLQNAEAREMWAPEASSQASTTSKVHSTTSWKEITPHQNCPTPLPPARRKSTEDGSIPNRQDGFPLHQPCLETQNPSVSENSLNGHATRCFETISLLFKQRFIKSHEPYYKKN